MRCPAKLSMSILHVHYHRGETLDAIVEMGVYCNDRAKHAVRLLTFRHGKTLYRYLTNVRDPSLLGAAEIAELSARRWDIEMAFRLIKQHLGLHLLWSAKPNVVLQQVWAVLIIAQITQVIRLEIAGRAGVDPFAVSLPLLIAWLPRLAARGVDLMATMVAEGRQIEIIRPSRRPTIWCWNGFHAIARVLRPCHGKRNSWNQYHGGPRSVGNKHGLFWPRPRAYIRLRQ